MALLIGLKRFEFRRSHFAPSVHTVVIYATSPVRAVVGEFAIRAVHADTPARLWRLAQGYTGIDRERFNRYFAGCSHGVAIEVEQARQYREHLPLCKLVPGPPPQSFRYLPTEFIGDPAA
jgi:predicted transcriptional regulator